MPRKTLKERQTKRPIDTDVNHNRIRAVSNNLIGNENPDDVMIELLEVLTEGPKSVQAGKMYIFVYNAKTNQLRYDQNPFVAVTDVFQWGFRGINLHWGESRQYTWDEVAGGMYEVYSSEVKDLQMLPFANFRLNT